MSYGEFVQVEGGAGTPQLWQRLPLGDTGGRNEAWLRDLLHANPLLIPIGDIDPSFGPLIPVCTELRTPAGPIDNVFIDRHGRLTLVSASFGEILRRAARSWHRCSTMRRSSPHGRMLTFRGR